MGSALYGGRWNPIGVELINTSIHASLAALEILANLDDLPRSYNLTEIQIPDQLVIEHVSTAELPQNWNLVRPYSPEAHTFGVAWISQARSAVLSVPSRVMWQVPSERNEALS